jgi:hypothetical protein
MNRKLWWSILALPAVLLCGCSMAGGDAAPTPATVTVKGKVVLPDGSPATGAAVVFEPIENGTEAFAILGRDGSFSMKTFGGGTEGVVPGKYKVAVTPNHGHTDLTKAAAAEGRRSIPKKYWESGTSELTVEVKGSVSDLTFRMK